MEVSGQLHAPSALVSSKESMVPNEQGAEWFSEQVWIL
jgi:hypothetical protein